MSWLDGLKQTLRPWLRRSAAERELQEELAFHVEAETDKNLAAGMDPDPAARAARRSLGAYDGVRDDVRGVWWRAFAGLGGDLRIGLRRLRRRPGFTLVAVVTLGLGIGANTAIYSLVRGLLLRPLPYADADGLVLFWNRAGDQSQDTWLSAREVVEYRRATRSFTDIAAYTDADATLAEGEPERVRAGFLTANAFATLGVRPLHGRPFDAQEDRPGHDGVVVLGHELWQRRYGAAPDVIGRDVRVSGRPRRVVGVMPPGFRLPLDYREERPTELWMPAAIDPAAPLPWGDRSYYVVGRLAPGVSARAATADLQRTWDLWRQTGEEGLKGEADRAAQPLQDLLTRRVRAPLLLLFGAVGLLLLIACANVSHLLLARGDARRREIATQAALGASRFRIGRQLVVECGLLALLGAGAGLLMARAALAAAVAATPVNVIRSAGVSLDPAVLAFAAGLALAATVAAGLAPALDLSRTDAAATLAAARGEGGVLRRRSRHLLVAGQAGLSLLLVTGAALLTRSFAQQRHVDLGFQPGDALTLRVDLTRADYPDAAQVVRTHREIADRVAALPGVSAAGAARILPLTGTIGDWSITIENRPAVEGENPNADWQIVTAGYLETMGIPIRRGRAITRADDERAPLVAVVNEAMASRYWPGQDPLGKRFHLGSRDQPWIEIVGLVGAVRHNAVLEDARAEMYLPHAQFVRAKNGGSAQYGMTLIARTAGDALRLLPLVREQVRAVDPRLPISDVRTLDAVTAAALAEPRFTTLLMSVLALLALALCGIGLYGVVSFITARRTHEIGVRMALGARPAAICALIVRDGLAMTVLGVALGLLGSLWAGRLLAGQLYGVSPLDPTALLAAPALLLAVAAAAALVPAWRAARADPAVALRHD
jgi:putative ABC transport system permease protein